MTEADNFNLNWDTLPQHIPKLEKVLDECAPMSTGIKRSSGALANATAASGTAATTAHHLRFCFSIMKL